MIQPVANSVNYQLARTLLDASVLRHEAIAGNIANSDTPGYRRVDLAPDFRTALRTQLSSGTPNPASISALRPTLAEDSAVRSVRADGNSVELEAELLALGQNRVEHEFLTDLVSRHIKQLRMAISGRASV